MFKSKLLKSLFVLLFISNVTLFAKETARQALTAAIKKGDLEKVESLIESSEVAVDELTDNYEEQSPLIEAAIEGKIAIIEFLIKKGANIEGFSKKNSSPLEKFIEASKRLSNSELINTVKLMLEAGADVNAAESDKYTALMAACEYTRSLDLVKLLLKKGAAINAQSTEEETPYLLALRNNNLPLYRLLISLGADTNVTYKEIKPLSLLAYEGNTFMMKILLNETNAHVNQYNPNGTTPLMCAAFGHQVAMIEFLLEQGADINATNKRPVYIELPNKNNFSFNFYKTYVAFPKECTALDFAITLGSVEIANLLFELGCHEKTAVEYKETSYLPFNFWH